ncbi:hypothetical protein MY1884_007640 [Beauveria asiatica]
MRSAAFTTLAALTASVSTASHTVTTRAETGAQNVVFGARTAKAIDTCKTNGVKVIMSLGGAAGAYSLSSKEEAEAIGQNLWEAYGNLYGKNGSVPRPFGKTFVNGWDFGFTR